MSTVSVIYCRRCEVILGQAGGPEIPYHTIEGCVAALKAQVAELQALVAAKTPCGCIPDAAGVMDAAACMAHSPAVERWRKASPYVRGRTLEKIRLAGWGDVAGVLEAALGPL